MMKRLLMTCMLLAALVCVCLNGAAAQEARDITAACNPTSPGKYTTNLYDGTYTGFWSSREQRNPYVEFTTPQDEPAEYLYICFGDMPKAWAIEEEVAGEWKTLIEGKNDYHHVIIIIIGDHPCKVIYYWPRFYLDACICFHRQVTVILTRKPRVFSES